MSKLPQLPHWIWLFCTAQVRKEEPCVLVSFMTCMLAVGLTHASSLHAPHNQCLHSFFLSFSFLLFRCFSPSFCSSSFWFCSLHFLMPLYLSWFFCSRFSLSCSFSVVYLTHFCFLYSFLSFWFFVINCPCT